ncbi:MAG: cyclic nucleotide-binding domain-containing protein [Anaerolineae bacterium]|nr:cyclic nucleotide-binding domain-containing protein [Anaerolineae bacterium]
MSIAEQLKASPLFKGVELADCEALVQAMHPQSYPAGTVLFGKDSAGDSVYIIVSGRIEIYTQDDQGRKLTIRHYGPSQLFGEFSLLDQKPRSASAAAIAPSEVLILHRDDFLVFLQERPIVGLTMMQTLVERVRYTTTYLQRVMDAAERLSAGEMEQAAQGFADSPNESEIQQLISTFLDMLQSVQARQASLKKEADTHPKSSGP